MSDEHEHDHEDESLIDRMRDTGVGVEDPNIVDDEEPHIEVAEPDDDKPIAV
jgi:hypothetical protein